jgi:hypothetical protein
MITILYILTIEKVIEILNNEEDDINGKNPSRKKEGNNFSFNKGGAPIHYAARSGHLQIVKLLLDKG